jgi:ribonuclease HI
VLSDADGEVVVTFSDTIGETSNNVAEYRALLRGLELAAEHGAHEVHIVNDSELVARQVSGVYKVKHPVMQELHREAMTALERFDSWSIESVPRARNAEADRLVNDALDR